MQGPIRSSSAQPFWPAEDRRQMGGAARVAGTNTGIARSGTAATAGFGPALRAATDASQTRSASEFYQIQPGDTLSAIAQRRLQELGLPSGGRQINQAVDQLAAANSLPDPNRIYAGDRLDLRVLEPRPLAAAAVPRIAVSDSRPAAAVRPLTPASPEPAAVALRQSSFPQLQKTLDRAVERGFVEPGDRKAVEDRIVALGRKFQFSPDDLATVALMESDGFNPRASSGRCHGILQFCEGPNSGAASVGMQGRASEIRDKPVLAQLDLVERYFEDNRLGEKGPVSLVDLYLTVLTPAARSEQRPHAALDIAGRQAKALHVSGDRSQPITRQSILSGLLSHAQQRLDALIHPKRVVDAQEARQGHAEPLSLTTAVDRVSRPAARIGVVPQAAPFSSQGRQG